MEIIKVDQPFLNRLELPSDMPDLPWIQWRVENIEEMVRFLEDFEIRMHLALGNALLIQGHGKLNLQLSPGDCLVLWPATAERPREKLGVIRVPGSVQHREADGLKTHSNVKNIERFLKH